MLAALAEGLDASAAERIFGYRQATITTWLWLAIDPLTKLLPVLELGPRTQTMAHRLIHSLRQSLAPDSLTLFTNDGLNFYFYALTAHFGQWPTLSRWQVKAGLIYGQVKKSYRRRKLVRVTHVMRLGTEDALTVALQRLGLGGAAEHCFDRAGESDRLSWDCCARSSYLGDSAAVLTPACSSGVVARVLSLCASSSIAADEARSATRTRGQIIGATRPPAHSSHGSRQNPPAMDGPRGARLPFVANFRLRATEARWGTVSGHGERSEAASRSSQRGSHSGGDGLSGLSPGKHPA